MRLFKLIVGLLGIILILFELYFHLIQKPKEEQLINDAKLITLFLLTADLNQPDLDENHDPNDVLYGEVT